MPLKLRLVLDVEYAPGNVTEETLRKNMEKTCQEAVAHSRLTRQSVATVIGYTISIATLHRGAGDSRTICMIVACTNASGIPDLFPLKLKTTTDAIANGEHYDRARVLAEEAGYEGPGFVCYDEDDGPAKLFAIFDWGPDGEYQTYRQNP